MFTEDIQNDPLLPGCLKQFPSMDKNADQWVMDTIRKLPPKWWGRLADGYNNAFNHTACYRPHQELNARKRMANAWLLDKLVRFA